MKTTSTLSLLALLLASSVNAQNSSAVTALVTALNSAGLTTLATTATKVANTTVGTQLLAALTGGGPFTIFAPNNHAFTGVPANISSKPDLVAEILSYHVLPGTFNATDFTTTANTVGKTLLNATDQVFLGPGDQHQALAARKEGNTTMILNQNTPVSVVSSSAVGNITVHVVDGVIDLPGSLNEFIDGNKGNVSTFRTAAQGVPGLYDLLQFTHGVTIFVPTNAAFQTALAALGANATNTTLIGTVLGNHVVNGSVVYSPQLATVGSPISASGESFNFTSNSTGAFVTSGNSTAKIISADNILWNGVVHIIDSVLANTQSDAGAASSAFQSATSAASSQATATQPGPIGGSGTGTASGAGSSSSTGAGMSLVKGAAFNGVAAVGVVVCMMLGGVMVL